MARIKFNNNSSYTYNLQNFSRNTYYNADTMQTDVSISLGQVNQQNKNIYDLGLETITSITFINDITDEIFLTLTDLNYKIQNISETWNEDHLNLSLILKTSNAILQEE